MFACMDASLKIVRTASFDITYTAYRILGSKQTAPLHQDLKLAQFKSIPS
jgi:hypothetical protein